MNREDMLFYWGCWFQPGHRLHAPGVSTVYDHDCDKFGIPRPHELDGSVLFLPRPEQVGFGALTYLPAPDTTILAWWGSPFDLRGRVNSALLVGGKATADECWDRFTARIPDLAAKLTKPTVVAAPYNGTMG